MRADLKDLRLPLESSAPSAASVPCGIRLRQSICKAIVARGQLQLPYGDEPLTWASWGVVLPERFAAQAPKASSLWDLYTRMRLCLNLPEHLFAKPGYYCTKEQVVASKPGRSKLSWAVFVSRGSKELAEAALAEPNARLVHLQTSLENQGKPMKP